MLVASATLAGVTRPDVLVVPGGGVLTPDFGEITQSGVEVVDYLEPVMRKLDLTDGLNSCSS